MTDGVMARVGGRGCGGAVVFLWGVGRLVRADRFGQGPVITGTDGLLPASLEEWPWNAGWPLN